MGRKSKRETTADYAAQVAYGRAHGGTAIAKGALRWEEGRMVRLHDEEVDKAAVVVAAEASEAARIAAMEATFSEEVTRQTAQRWQITDAQARQVLAMAEGIRAGQRAATDALGLKEWPIHEPDPKNTSYVALDLWEGWSKRPAVSPRSPRTCPECSRTFTPWRKDQRFCSEKCGRRARNREWRLRRGKEDPKI